MSECTGPWSREGLRWESESVLLRNKEGSRRLENEIEVILGSKKDLSTPLLIMQELFTPRGRV